MTTPLYTKCSFLGLFPTRASDDVIRETCRRRDDCAADNAHDLEALLETTRAELADMTRSRDETLEEWNTFRRTQVAAPVRPIAVPSDAYVDDLKSKLDGLSSAVTHQRRGWVKDPRIPVVDFNETGQLGSRTSGMSRLDCILTGVKRGFKVVGHREDGNTCWTHDMSQNGASDVIEQAKGGAYGKWDTGNHATYFLE